MAHYASLIGPTCYSELAAKYGLLLYPFFLEGIASDVKLDQRDGVHPTAAGIDKVVAGILGKVEGACDSRACATGFVGRVR